MISDELYQFLNRDKIIPINILKELLLYNPDTGNIYWNVNFKNIKKGKLAGTKSSGKTGGYVTIEICGKAYKAHRIAWALYYGIFPDENLTIDHIDRIRDNNRIINLRLVTIKENAQNKTRKHNLPLYIYKHRNKLAVRITTDKFRTYGSFLTIEEAILKRDEVLKKLNITIKNNLWNKQN